MAAVAHVPGDLRGGMDRAVHWPSHRRQTPFVLQGRAVPAHRPVVAARPSVPEARHLVLAVGIGLAIGTVSSGRTMKRARPRLADLLLNQAYHPRMLNPLDLYDVRGL